MSKGADGRRPSCLTCEPPPAQGRRSQSSPSVLGDGMSRKTRPVPRRGDRGLQWDAASRVEVGLARRSIVESLVWPDAVVDVAESGGLHR